MHCFKSSVSCLDPCSILLFTNKEEEECLRKFLEISYVVANDLIHAYHPSGGVGYLQEYFSFKIEYELSFVSNFASFIFSSYEYQ